MSKLKDWFMGYKEIQVFKVQCYPVLNDIEGLRETAMNIDEAIKRTFLGHAKLALVGCGTSGASIMTAISVINGIDCCLIKKSPEDENCHRGPMTLKTFGTNYNHLIVVDDMIETGQTMARISTVLYERKEANHLVKMVCVHNAHEKREQLLELFPNCKYFCY